MTVPLQASFKLPENIYTAIMEFRYRNTIPIMVLET